MKSKSTTSKSPSTRRAKVRPGSTARVSSAVRSASLKRILVPIDFSDASREALRYAWSFADKFKARILPLHVVEPMVYPTDVAFAPLTVEFPVQVSLPAMRKRLHQWCMEVVPGRLLDKPMVKQGQPYHEIARAAQSLKMDLIILSTHGYTGLKHVFLGSTAERVVRHATCPVLTVRYAP